MGSTAGRGAPMRVCHVITGLERGGAETALVRLLGGLDRAEFAPTVLSLTDRGVLGGAVEEAGAELHCLGWRRGRPPMPGQGRPLARRITAAAPDLVQTWLYHADLAGLLAVRFGGGGRLPVLWNIRCSDMDFSNYGRGTRLTVRLAALLSRLPAGVVVNSAAGRRVHEGLGYRPRAWHLIPNGIDAARFRPDPAAAAEWRAAVGLPDDTVPLIGHVARNDPQKDHPGFLQALSGLARRGRAFRAVLAGRGTEDLAPLRDGLGLGDHVRLLGERDDMAAMMAALDLFCMSAAYGEGFPNVLAEAMACGVPAVTTDVGDAALILERPDRVVPPRVPAALEAALDAALQLSPHQRRAEGAAARARVLDRFTLERSVAQYRRLYGSFAAGGRVSVPQPIAGAADRGM